MKLPYLDLILIIVPIICAISLGIILRSSTELMSEFLSYTVYFLMAGIITPIGILIYRKVTQQESSSSEREDHKKAIISDLKKLTHVHIITERDYLICLKIPRNVDKLVKSGTIQRIKTLLAMSPSEFFPMEELDYWEWIESHLKDENYEGVWKPLSEVRRLINEYNTLDNEIIAILNQRIKEGMVKNFPIFKEFTNEDLPDQNYFHLRHIRGLLFDSLMIFIQKSEKSDFGYVQMQPKGSWWQIERNGRFLIGSPKLLQLDVDKFKQFLSSINEDASLIDKCKKLVAIHSNVTEPFNKFLDALERLVKRLDGGSSLQGKCAEGY